MLSRPRTLVLVLGTSVGSLALLLPIEVGLARSVFPVIGESGEQVKTYQLEIPEVYGLINIGIALSSFGEASKTYVAPGTPYHAEILERISAYKDHPFIRTIQEFHGDVDGFNFLKMSAAASHFEGDRIECDKSQLYLPSAADEAELSEELSLAEDFAKDSGFRIFYAEHLPLYEERLAVFKEAVPILDAWDWLESHLPAAPPKSESSYPP